MQKDNTLLYSIYVMPAAEPGGQPTCHVRPVAYGAQTTDEEMKADLQRNTRVNSSQFIGMIEVLREEIPQQLLQNKPVHIEGMGTFYLRIGVRRRRDADGRWYKPQFHRAEEITAADLCVEGIGFRADPTWNRRVQLSGQQFAKAPYAGHGVPIDADELSAWLAGYLSEHHHVTVREFRLAWDCTNYQARKTLESLCRGDHPRLVRQEIARAYVYRLAED